MFRTRVHVLAERLAARDLSVRFDGVAALGGVDLDIARGEILGLIGPNGAGKTTLVNVLSGHQRPDTGRIELGGREVTRWPPARRASAGLVRTFQGVRPFGALTVAENVVVGALSTGVRGSAAEAVAGELIARLGLADQADLPASALSYGMLRRLSIARALAPGPDFLLLDEPAAGLDETETRELGDLLIAIRADFGCGLVLIEHDVPLVMRVCDRVQVLVLGRTLHVGTPEQTVRAPLVRAAYLGGDEAEPTKEARGA
jgi:ABC-type branched-subunit amino acid transport system ATPase component